MGMARRTRIDTFDTASSTIRIDTRENLRTLFIDDAESSAIDLSDPTHLEFEYMQHIRVAVDASFPGNGGLRVLHLGGAGCALARCFAALRPRSRQLAIEIDPELATIARAHFDLPASPALRIRTQDARTTLDTNSGKWQVIVRDTFMDGVIPSIWQPWKLIYKLLDCLPRTGSTASISQIGRYCPRYIARLVQLVALRSSGRYYRSSDYEETPLWQRHTVSFTQPDRTR